MEQTVSPENTLGYTAVTYAVINSRSWGGYWHVAQPDPRLLEILLAAGAQYRLREAVLLNDIELVRTKLDEEANVNTGEGTYDGPLLKIAAELGYLNIVDILLDYGANIEATDDLGQRALLSAARFGRIDVVHHLLDRSAEVNAVDWSGQSALSNSAVGRHYDVVELLMTRGAERGVVDALVLDEISLFEVLLDKELRSGSTVDGLNDGRVRLAMLAVERGNVAAVRLLLDRGAANFLASYDEHTLLVEAARYGHVHMVRLLIERGADLHVIGKDELTPLAWAIREGYVEVARMLKIAGAER